MAYEKDQNEIGALWVKSGTKGDYMTGEVNGVKVVCFSIANPRPNGPAWRVLESQPKPDTPRPDQAPSTAEPVTVDDIPFAWLLPLVGLLGAGLV